MKVFVETRYTILVKASDQVQSMAVSYWGDHVSRNMLLSRDIAVYFH